MLDINEKTEDFVSQVVNEFSDTIYRVAFNMTGSNEDSYDICQEVFLRLLKHKDKIKNNEHLKAWLIRTAINCSKSYNTEAYRRYTVPIDDVPEKSLSSTHKFDDTIHLVMKLPTKYRSVIHLYYYEDFKIEDISKTLDISQSAVKARLSRGRKLLKKYIEKEDNCG